jgi:hypothetical protein
MATDRRNAASAAAPLAIVEHPVTPDGRYLWCVVVHGGARMRGSARLNVGV